MLVNEVANVFEAEIEQKGKELRDTILKKDKTIAQLKHELQV